MAWHHIATPRRGSGPVWVGLGLVGLAVLMGLGAHWIWRVLLGLPLAWAIVDLVVNRSTVLELDDHAICVIQGDKRERTPLADITKVVLHRRMDLSTIVTLHMHNGARRRLPPDCAPPLHALAQALRDHGVSVEMKVFSLI